MARVSRKDFQVQKVTSRTKAAGCNKTSTSCGGLAYVRASKGNRWSKQISNPNRKLDRAKDTGCRDGDGTKKRLSAQSPTSHGYILSYTAICWPALGSTTI
eukprot:scaffold400_cov185-Amphora_coffeaeformis.AAC.4